MLSRRAFLGSIAAAGATLRGCESALLATASQPRTAVTVDVPPGACDCHTHIFGDATRYPWAPVRAYTPEPASLDEMRALHRALRMERVVIVQPSVYGVDNACTLDASRAFGARGRAVVVIDERTPDAALDEMHRAGARGVRINLETSGQTDPAQARQRLLAAIDRVRSRNWHVQVYTRLSVIDAIRNEVMAAPVPIVFDHFGGAQAALGVDQPGFATLVNLVRGGKAYVKISGAYRSSTQAPDYADVTPLAQALVAANPQRIVWGTDWPHPDSAQVPGRKTTDIAPLQQVDDGRLLNQLPRWVPNAAVRRTILVENPARLYGF